MSGSHWDMIYEREGRRWGNRPGELARVAVARLAGTGGRDLRILDVGCGYGRDAVYLAAALSAWVVGVDPAAPAIDLARASAPPHLTLEFRCAHVEEVADGPYGVVFVSNVFHGLRPRERASLSSAAGRLLAPGGLLFLSTLAVGDPTHYGAGSPLPRDRESFAGSTYLHFSTPDSLRAELGGRFLFERLDEVEFVEPHTDGPDHRHRHVIAVASLRVPAIALAE